MVTAYGVTLLPTRGCCCAPPKADVPKLLPNALPDEAPNGDAATVLPKAGVELAPKAGVLCPNTELPPNAGAAAPNAGVDVDAPKPELDAPPKAGVVDAPKAGVEDAPNAGVDAPNSGVVVLPKAGVDWAPKAGVVDPKAWLPPNAG